MFVCVYMKMVSTGLPPFLVFEHHPFPASGSIHNTGILPVGMQMYTGIYEELGNARFMYYSTQAC